MNKQDPLIFWSLVGKYWVATDAGSWEIYYQAADFLLKILEFFATPKYFSIFEFGDKPHIKYIKYAIAFSTIDECDVKKW